MHLQPESQISFGVPRTIFDLEWMKTHHSEMYRQSVLPNSREYAVMSYRNHDKFVQMYEVHQDI